VQLIGHHLVLERVRCSDLVDLRTAINVACANYTFFPEPACIMPALVAPPRHCIPDIRRKMKGETDALVEDLQPFACGMMGRSVEVLEPQSCEVQGVLPHWLQGQLYRNGPGVWDVETKCGETFSLAHW